MAQYGAFHFGREAPSRIATSTAMMMEAYELLPGEPVYQPLVPFLPAISSGGTSGSGSASGDTQVWQRYPSRCDLSWYQGDDVIIPLYFDNPGDIDMSDQDGYEWHAEVRVLHTYHSTLVNTFSIDSLAIPADPETEAPAMTRVSLFLPRSENVYVGKYRWDLYSISPIEENMDEYPRPPDVIDPEPWPPTTQLRTWLYGVVTILPRVTETDFLPAIDEGDGSSGGETVMAFFVGPNGRVP